MTLVKRTSFFIKCWLEILNSSAQVNSTVSLKIAWNRIILEKKYWISVIIIVIHGEILCFSVWQTSHWKVVCQTKFHRPHSKNVKSLLPVWQQVFQWIIGWSVSAWASDWPHQGQSAWAEMLSGFLLPEFPVPHRKGFCPEGFLLVWNWYGLQSGWHPTG